MKITRLPQALTDLVEAVEFLADDDPELADRIFDAFESAVETISRNPKIGAVRESENYHDVRMWFVRGYEKLLIFYRITADEVVILRVIHTSRDFTRFIS